MMKLMVAASMATWWLAKIKKQNMTDFLKKTKINWD
jgi:hypothetical protein